MNYPEDDLLPLSRLSDLLFCERRAALHLIENVWEDNVATVQGTQLHARTHEPGTESRREVRTSTGLRFRSLRLGLSGKADVVEWHRLEPGAGGVALPGVAGVWQPYPVEYKRGKARVDRCYEVQLCAQALCLEEMLGVRIPLGALYAAARHERREVVLDEALRQETEAASARMHALFAAGQTPPPEYGEKCKHCSLVELCLPRQAGGNRSVAEYLASAGT